MVFSMERVLPSKYLKSKANYNFADQANKTYAAFTWLSLSYSANLGQYPGLRYVALAGRIFQDRLKA